MFNAIILGLVQGLTEFLPVSSSGHVLVFEQILNFKDNPGFAAAIHLATCLAAIIYFRKDIISILKSFINFNSKTKADIDSRNLGIKIILATIPAAILGLIVTKLEIDSYFSNLTAIGISSIVFGLILYFAEKYSLTNTRDSNATTENDNQSGLSNLKAILIGASQIIAAIFPGASRSGVSLTASFFSGLQKEQAARFAFLISIPITALASLDEIVLKKSVQLNLEFGVAFIAAFLSGLFAIYILLKLINTKSLKWICAYRVLFGIVLTYYGLTH